ncbi:putative cation-transporting ATPase 13A3 [Choanephora cucurbitarum]|uniref:Putative cation-transporting ATPase 13A3 n=1 Tax=Choanephora cucurbitarum TaxID=101091 RepID=A0A1C7NIB0_9FUNG|nr:putative cation-transporting ATPase 13A3 [Choanephora cucurbitarum]
MACRTPLYVDIQHYNPERATIQLHESCSRSMINNTAIVDTWATLQDSDKNQMVWNVCDAPKGVSFPIQAITVIFYLSVYLGFFPLWALWAFYKFTKEKTHQPVIHEHAIIEEIKCEEQTEKHEKEPMAIMEKDQHSEEEMPLQQKGFRSDIFGGFMMIYVAFISVVWVVILLIISLDYYGYVVQQTPFGLFYNSYDLSSKAFCLAWFLATSWYLFINIARTKIRNHFRIAVPFSQANYIRIKKPRKVIQMKNESYQQQGLTSLLGHFEDVVRQWLGFDALVVTVPVLYLQDTKYFEFQSTRYYFDGATQQFQPVNINTFFSWHPQALLEMHQGLDESIASARVNILGPNFIDVNVPSFFKALWEELTGFFYIYQLMILWCYFYLAYWQIGLSDTCVILLAALIKVVVRLRSEKRVKKMAEHIDSCHVLRDSQWQSNRSTADLVPGDVIRVEANKIVPVDAVILRGDIIVDESSLTGEPLPIRKFPLRLTSNSSDRTPFNPQSSTGKNNTLFAGTTAKQCTPDAIALVLRTRTDTDKGQLIQRILFPQPVSFIFNEQLKLVFCLLLIWAVVLLGFGAWWLGGSGMTAWFYGTICAAQVMNPLLPAILVVGQSVAAGRLKKKGVYCVDFPRILMAGKVQVFCFDKTGTLTNEGLEFFGIQSATNGQFEDAQYEFNHLTTSRLLQMGLSSCHSVTMLRDDYIGNPVDIVMFKATGASIAPGDIITSSTLPTLHVVQRFEFQHERASMSVAVKDASTGHVHVFCKGSFEKIAETARYVPEDFYRVTSDYTKVGCYVLGIAHRDLGVLTPEQEADLKNNWTRDQLESNLDFAGLVLFKNQLKPDTTAAIQQIKQGDVRVVMITGDTALTGVFIGKQCGLVPSQDTNVILADVASTDDGEKLIWTHTDTDQIVADIEPAIASGCELAMTGKAFRWFMNEGTIRDYLFDTRIFARMTPVDKMQCIELFMEKTITAMCGDGGNDCGALRSAHVGIAMSETEASVVSPFSTPNRSVQACVELLIQGRSALATSFASYKYLIMYGETMATVKFCTFYYTMSFSQWNFILIDAFITVFCAFAVTQAGAAKRLSSHRPTARILGPEVLLSVLGQLWINVWFLIGSFIWLYTRDDFFTCREWDARATDASKWWLLGDSFEADVLTFIALFQFVNSAMVFNYGYLFRRAWYRNYLLVAVWATFVAIVSYWELADPNPFGCLMRLNCGNPDVLVSLGYPRPDFYIEPYNNPLGHNVLPKSFRYQLWVYSIINMLTVHVWERFFVLGPIRQWFRQRYPLKRIVLKQ